MYTHAQVCRNLQEFLGAASTPLVRDRRHPKALPTHSSVAKAVLTRREAECKLSLEVTFLALQVIIRDNHHHPAAPKGEWTGCRHCGNLVQHTPRGQTHEESTVPKLDRARLGESQHLDLSGRALCTHPPAPWPLSQPLFNELTGNGPDTGARQDITIGYTQLQPIVCLFQLPDHLLNKLDIAGAVADEGIKTLGHLPWVQSTRMMSKLYRRGAQPGTPV